MLDRPNEPNKIILLNNAHHKYMHTNLYASIHAYVEAYVHIYIKRLFLFCG